jgi:hypothetical protein
MKLGTHMPGGERRKPIDNEVKIEQKFDTFFVSARYIKNEILFTIVLSDLRFMTDKKSLLNSILNEKSIEFLFYF